VSYREEPRIRLYGYENVAKVAKDVEGETRYYEFEDIF